MTRKRRFRAISLVPLVWAFVLIVATSAIPEAAPEALAQSATATLVGTVVDQDSAVVTDANVSLVNTGTGLRRQATTSVEGYFVFPLLPPGRYTVKAQREGFATAEVPSLVLNVNDRIGIRIQLKVGPVNQTVDVIDTLAIQNQAASVSTVIDRQFASELPLNGRSFDSLFRLTPGTAVAVAESYDPGQFSFNGQRPNANYVMVDGVGANVGISPGFYLEQSGAGTGPPVSALGGTNGLVSVDALQEFRIETSSYSAEFGRTPGAQISIITRSGSNEFHGTAFNYVRNDVFDANDWFANALGLAKAPLRQNDFGGVLGGPIVRNRTFFFASYEGLRLRLPHVAALTSVPSMSLRQSAPPSMQPLLNTFPVPNGRDFGDGIAEFSASFSNPSTVDATSVRIDHTVNSRLSLFGRYNDSPSDAAYRGGFISASLSMPNRVSTRTITATLGATAVFGPRVSNDFKFNYSRVKAGVTYPIDHFGGAAPPPVSALFPSFVNPAKAGFNFHFLNVAYWGFGPVAENFQRQLNIVNNLSAAIGPHAFRFGVDYRRLSPISGIQQYSLRAFFNTAENVLSGQVPFLYVTASNGHAYPVFTNFSAYAQDAWRIGRRLTLTYGVRWELNPPPTDANGDMPFTVRGLDNPATMTLAPKGTPFFETTYGNFAPRVGVTYQLFEAPGRKTVLRGGFGVFYDLGAGTAASAFGGNSFPNSSVKLVRDAQFSLTSEVFAPLPFNSNPPYPYLVVTDPHLSLPRTYQWNAAVEQSLGRSQTLSMSYVGAAGRRLLRREYLSNPNPNFTGFEVTRNAGFSDYHSLQIQFQRRLSRGLQALASYAWGHATDSGSFESENFRPVAAVGPVRDHASSDFDVRHSLSVAATYNLPSPVTSGPVGPLFRSWAFDAILRVNSATPVNVIVSNSNVGFTRPDLIAGVPLYIDDPAVARGRRINRAAFSLPASNQQGTLGRNALRGFPVSQTDIALVREFRLMERLQLQFRAEAFNVFNHPNFAQPVKRINNPNFGRSTEMLNQSLSYGGGLNKLYQIGGPRSIQLSMKLHF